MESLDQKAARYKKFVETNAIQELQAAFSKDSEKTLMTLMAYQEEDAKNNFNSRSLIFFIQAELNIRNIEHTKKNNLKIVCATWMIAIASILSFIMTLVNLYLK